jgi:hypothetical protein
MNGPKMASPSGGPVEDGNRSDNRLNRKPMDWLGAAVSPETLRGLVHVADSALVTVSKLAALAAAGIA